VLERAPHWAFLRSFAALEAFFENPVVSLDEVKTSARDTVPAAAKPAAPTAAVASAGLSLEELYGETSLIEDGSTQPELPPLEPLEPTVSPKASKRRPDPFEQILPYLTGQVAPEQPKADPFELLGAQFGL
jgi:hypothetical protein